MARRAPYIRDRGISAPPPGYRPGLKARWLNPRSIHPRPVVPDMPFTLISFPFTEATPGLLDPPVDGALFAAIPAAGFIEGAIFLTLTPDQPGQFVITISTGFAQPKRQLINTTHSPGQSPSANLGTTPEPLSTANLVSADSLYNQMQNLNPQEARIAFYSDATPPTAFSGTAVLKLYS